MADLRVGDWTRVAIPGVGGSDAAVAAPSPTAPVVRARRTCTKAEYQRRRGRRGAAGDDSPAAPDNVAHLPAVSSASNDALAPAPLGQEAAEGTPRYCYRHEPSGMLHWTPPAVFGGAGWHEWRLPSGELCAVRYDANGGGIVAVGEMPLS